ncbi:hypothetical protein ENUP19_0274G0068 [Entamoeba nuttalli]|uniref:Tryptophanyl-tRNA synthetase n=2 Tax=Entamoeba nuttalli TaxID=412467 RepID=K2GVX7_ENTNP|nr:tryptophanyl-tRNA synthetase, putative [Entamoeba nuttalli P19]EKE37977.1 tryptophanyl-tRNA synthetase, putative [Entamoeba nuttalli P19]|eukprot:XP_008859688.1 tryptophanyl-tRNA synthetase, putative [Entamoeba nuttalli P19]
MSLQTQTPSQLLQSFTTRTTDYNQLIYSVGINAITPQQIQRIEKLSGKAPHHYLSRGVFLAEKSLDKFLDDVEAKKPTFIFIQKYPQKEIALEEYVTLEFARYLQDAFNIQVIIQILDDIKVLNREATINEASKMSNDLMKYILAFGFNEDKTFIYTDYQYFGKMYRTISLVEKATAYNVVQPFFNFEYSDNIGKLASPSIMTASMFSQSYSHFFSSPARCLVLDSIKNVQFHSIIDQIASTLNFIQPTVLFHKMVPLLSGVTKFDIPSDHNSILLSDNAKQVERKINKLAFSGGRNTTEEHKKLGGQCDIDVSFQLLNIFSSDSAQVKDVEEKYSKGELLSGELKKIVSASMKDFIVAYDAKKKPITTAYLKAYISKTKF